MCTCLLLFAGSTFVLSDSFFFSPDCLRLVQDMSCGAGAGSGGAGGGGQTHLGAANHTHFGSVLLWK